MVTILTNQPPTPRTSWHSWRQRQQEAIYLDAVAGYGIATTGEIFRYTGSLPLRELVEKLPVEIATVYLCGTLPSAPQVGLQDAQEYSPFNSWVVASYPERMHLSSGVDHAEAMVVMQRSDGHEVDVRTVASWLSTNEVTPEQAARELTIVTSALRQQHNWENASLLKTPSLTGRELWRSSIGMSKQPDGKYTSLEYQILPEELRNLIHRTSGQGRFEMLPCPTPDGYAPELYYLDDRFAYAAQACKELGIGPAVLEQSSQYAGWTPARYHVRFRVLDNWNHVGVLPMQRQLVKGAEAIGLDFPRQPGYIGETWVDAWEMRIALAPFPTTCPTCLEIFTANDGRRCPLHGWHIDILERIVFTKGRPLRTLAEKLIEVREACGPSMLAQAAVRNIVVHTVGSLHGTRRPITRTASNTRQVPSGTPLQRVLSPSGDEIYLWQEEGFTPKSPDYDRPEWSSQIWAHQRASTLLRRDGQKRFSGALTLPLSSIVAFRLDAMYMTINPNFPDDGHTPGQLRQKGYLPGPVVWPQEETDLASIKERLS